jgi:DNA-binding NarL/FixJ family response regulator
MLGDGVRVPSDFDRIKQKSASGHGNKQVTGKQSSANTEGAVAIIESRNFLQECIRRSIQSAFTRPVETYSSVLEFETTSPSMFISLIILSLSESSIQVAVDSLQALSALAPKVPIVVLSCERNLQLARVAIEQGAKGYIPVTMGFEIAIEAVRFVLAGGSYVPVDFFLTPDSREALPQRRLSAGTVTSRELEVVWAIQQGKPNKIIAAELNMCESTVKVHVRHIMKKLAAKNRTDVAIKSSGLMCSKCKSYSQCWSTTRCAMGNSSLTDSLPRALSLADKHYGDVSRRSI